LPLSPTTHEFLTLVEKETGYTVKVREDPDLPTLATIRMARGRAPARFLTYKPTRDESLDYCICYQCGFVLRLPETPPEQRFDFASATVGRDQVRKEMVGSDGTLAARGLDPAQAEQVAAMVFDGLMTHLRSIPVGMRIADWIYANYPALHSSQHTTALKELAEAKASLQPEIRAMTPERACRATIAINAAYALFWADKYGRHELASPYSFAGYEPDGRKPMEIWRDVPVDAAHDRELIDRWAEELGLTGWYQWLPYQAPD
jgi:hypothetical protein